MMKVRDKDLKQMLLQKKRNSGLLAGSFLQEVFVCLSESVQETFLNQFVHILSVSWKKQQSLTTKETAQPQTGKDCYSHPSPKMNPGPMKNQ